jgi:hypothetical protein
MEVANKYSFKGVIQDAGGGGAYVEVPFDVEQAFGSKRPKVRAVIEGIPYRGTLVRMRSQCHILGILKSIREQTGKTVGDDVQVTVELDTEPRMLELPEELRTALLKEKDAASFFNSLSYTHKQEYVNYILEAKRPETRFKRTGKVIDGLKQGKKGI